MLGDAPPPVPTKGVLLISVLRSRERKPKEEFRR